MLVDVEKLALRIELAVLVTQNFLAGL